MAADRSRANTDLWWVTGWIALLWLVEAADMILRAASHGRATLLVLGVRPHRIDGLPGIVCAPFLHGNWHHLIVNSASLFVTATICCGYGRRLTFAAAVWAALIGGTLTWIFGQENSVHVGASGVVFGLIGFILASALVRRGCGPLILGLAILVLFGGAIIGGLVTNDPHISALMHIGGFGGGIAAGWHYRNRVT